MAAVRHLGFLKLKFLTSVHSRNTFCISTQTLVMGIGHMVAEISRFFIFFSGENVKIHGKIAFNMAQLCQS